MVDAAIFFVLLKLSEGHSFGANITSDWAGCALRGFMFDEVRHSIGTIAMLALTLLHHDVFNNDVEE